MAKYGSPGEIWFFALVCNLQIPTSVVFTKLSRDLPYYYTHCEQNLWVELQCIYRNHDVRLSLCWNHACPGHYPLLSAWIGMILHTLVHDPRMCHDLDPRSYFQGQGHRAHIAQIRVRAITPYNHNGFLKYFTHDPRVS